jgi:uncharacterized phage protein (TIGR01671 family)
MGGEVMGEIKFRIWCKNKNEWEKDTVAILSSGNILHIHANSRLPCMIKKETHDIQLFIGRKDKRGKDIYAGDILNNEDYPFKNEGVQGYLGIVEWFKEDLCWSISVVCVNSKLRGTACGCSFSDHDNWEIIGNVHENSGVLNKHGG